MKTKRKSLFGSNSVDDGLLEGKFMISEDSLVKEWSLPVANSSENKEKKLDNLLDKLDISEDVRKEDTNDSNEYGDVPTVDKVEDELRKEVKPKRKPQLDDFMDFSDFDSQPVFVIDDDPTLDLEPEPVVEEAPEPVEDEPVVIIDDFASAKKGGDVPEFGVPVFGQEPEPEPEPEPEATVETEAEAMMDAEIETEAEMQGSFTQDEDVIASELEAQATESLYDEVNNDFNEEVPVETNDFYQEPVIPSYEENVSPEQVEDEYVEDEYVEEQADDTAFEESGLSFDQPKFVITEEVELDQPIDEMANEPVFEEQPIMEEVSSFEDQPIEEPLMETVGESVFEQSVEEAFAEPVKEEIADSVNEIVSPQVEEVVNEIASPQVEEVANEIVSPQVEEVANEIASPQVEEAVNDIVASAEAIEDENSLEVDETALEDENTIHTEKVVRETRVGQRSYTKITLG